MGTGLKAVDRLVEVLAESDLYICILADSRRDVKEHGSPVEIANMECATSYFEIELYAAAMQGKKPHLFILDGFSPGQRLKSLLHLLSFAIPDWHEQKPKSADTILGEIRKLIASHLRNPQAPGIPLRKRLVREYYMARAKKSPPGHEIENVLFLDGQFETRQKLPQKDLVESLLLDFDRVPEMQRKLSRMWLAARELMAAPYLPKNVQADSRLVDFLPLWDKVLGYWTSAAAWNGWHGHITAGTVAPLHSQAIIRAQLNSTHRPSGMLASAYYSIANLMPVGFRRLECLNRAARYNAEAIQQTGGQSASEFAVRGSIRLRYGNAWSAVSDFKTMLRLREKAGESEDMIGDALVHLGYGYLFCGRWFTGRDYIEQGLQAISKNPDNPAIARAKRKLAVAYKLTGKFTDSKKIYAEAQKDAKRLGALDQTNR